MAHVVVVVVVHDWAVGEAVHWRGQLFLPNPVEGGGGGGGEKGDR
jgi:hypothetical protein